MHDGDGQPYRHAFLDGTACDLRPGKAVCVGRNYLEHIRELDNPVPERPILFLKPSTAFVGLSAPIRLPEHGNDCQHEVELAVLIGARLTAADPERIGAAIAGYALALDLTLRDVQTTLKKQGHPWEIAKAFDGSCPISPFVHPAQLDDPQATSLSLSVDGSLRQQGTTAQMMVPILELIAYASRIFTLEPGDVVLTGTPAGVSRLSRGSTLVMTLDERYRFEATVA